MTYSSPKTYRHSVVASGMEIHVQLLIDDLLDAASALQSAGNCSTEAVKAMSRYLHDDMSGMNQSQFSQGMDLLDQSIELIKNATQLRAPSAIRSTALSLLHTPVQAQSIIERLQDRTSPIKSKNGVLEDGDVNAITFLILDKSEKPGVIRRSLKEIFETTPPDYTQTHVIFAEILIKKASYNIAARNKTDEPSNNGSSGASSPSLP